MSTITLIFILIFNLGFAQKNANDEVKNQLPDSEVQVSIPTPPVVEKPTQTFSAPAPLPPTGNSQNQLPPPEPEQNQNFDTSGNSNSQTIELINEGRSENMSPMLNSRQSNQSLSWDPSGKRDPFKPYRAPRTIKQNSDVAVDPLTLLDLSQVQVVAILWNNKVPRAVISGAGKFYTIFKRTNIGPNNGIVAEIREGEVIVIETFDDGFGNVVKEVKPLRLNKLNAQPGSMSSGS